MKIVGISCGPRKGKTTKYALENCLSAIEQACPQVDTEFIDLAEMEINGCKACGHCMKKLECR